MAKRSKLMPVPCYTPEQNTDLILNCHPTMDREMVLGFERGLLTNPGHADPYTDFLMEHGCWWRCCEIESELE